MYGYTHRHMNTLDTRSVMNRKMNIMDVLAHKQVQDMEMEMKSHGSISIMRRPNSA